MKFSRLYFIDWFRGFLVLGMIVYHFFFNLYYFFDYSPSFLLNFVIEALGHFVRFFFILLVGVSSRILLIKAKSIQEYQAKQLKRFLPIFTGALVVSAVVKLFLNELILFGILHFISVAIVFLSLIVKVRQIIPFVIFLSLLGYHFDFVLVALGFSSPNVAMLDFFPVFPWILPSLLGFYIFPFLIEKLIRIDSYLPKVRFLDFLGKHSLIIYLVHQPVIIGLMLAVSTSLHI